MMIEPGAMQAWIVSSRVATVRSGTAYMKTSLVPADPSENPLLGKDSPCVVFTMRY